MLFLVAYDIPDDGTRTEVANELENWGTRVQYSVFECDLPGSLLTAGGAVTQTDLCKGQYSHLSSVSGLRRRSHFAGSRPTSHEGP
jgi:CRISPR-associated endonuclease Cas2